MFLNSSQNIKKTDLEHALKGQRSDAISSGSTNASPNFCVSLTAPKTFEQYRFCNRDLSLQASV